MLLLCIIYRLQQNTTAMLSRIMMFSAVINKLCKFGLQEHLKSYIQVSFQLYASTKYFKFYFWYWLHIFIIANGNCCCSTSLLFGWCSVFPCLCCDYVLFFSTCSHICSLLPNAGPAFVLQCTIGLCAHCFQCISCAVVLFYNIFLKCVNCSLLTLHPLARWPNLQSSILPSKEKFRSSYFLVAIFFALSSHVCTIFLLVFGYTRSPVN